LLSEYSIERFQSQHSEKWDRFVWQANNGTIFHTRKFLGYHPPDRFEEHSLIVLKKTKWIALLPVVVIEEKDKRILFSHRGASYGGFVHKHTVGVSDAFRIVEATLEYAKGQNFDGIDVTLPPQCYLYRPSDYIEFAMIQLGFHYRKREISSVIPLDFAADQILSTFSESSRRAVRRAQKLNVVVRKSEDYQTFYKILKKNLQLRHNVHPTHTLDELLLLKKMYPERIQLYAAFHDQTMVAGVVLFLCNPHVVLAFYISHDDDLQKYRGVNLLFHDIILWGIKKKVNFLDFGIFTVNEDPNWGLAKFKESFGAQGIFRNSLRIHF
jgi:hypothetical protein